MFITLLVYGKRWNEQKVESSPFKMYGWHLLRRRDFHSVIDWEVHHEGTEEEEEIVEEELFHSFFSLYGWYSFENNWSRRSSWTQRTAARANLDLLYIAADSFQKFFSERVSKVP